jgi:ankyrin repeat protein
VRTAFIKAACVPRDASHASGTLETANQILAAHPEIAASDIHTAAILGNDTAVSDFVASDAGAATSVSEPYGWDALTDLCFSRYVRLDRSRSPGFVRAAEALLAAGASANTGFFEAGHEPNPTWESVLYGAAGIAHHAGLTRVLLAYGADPNDDEVPYHSPETHDNRALTLILESGRLTPDSMATMLLRKTDWHDYDGIELLLQHGADPNYMTRFGRAALHHAILRDNDLELIDLLLDAGADARLTANRPGDDAADGARHGSTAVAMAARRGRRDVLDSLVRRGVAIDLDGIDRLAAACARGDTSAIQTIVEREPGVVAGVRERGGDLLVGFAGVGNTEGVRRLLDLGVPVDAPYEKGDPYYGVPTMSTALHVAAWRARHETVKLLIERGAAIDLADRNGRTPLALAVRACVDSYWCDRRAPDSVRALVAAGASVRAIATPCGNAEVDELLGHGHPPA